MAGWNNGFKHMDLAVGCCCGFRLLNQHDGYAVAYGEGQFVGLAHQKTISRALFKRTFADGANQNVNQLWIQCSPLGLGSRQVAIQR